MKTWAPVWALSVLLLAGCGDSDSTTSPNDPEVVDTTPPAVPVNLQILNVDGAIELDWDDNSEADLAGYALERTLDDGTTWTAVQSGPIVDSEFVDSYYSRVSYRLAALDVSENQSAYGEDVQYVASTGPGGKDQSNPANP
jgi:hypothetical protein